MNWYRYLTLEAVLSIFKLNRCGLLCTSNYSSQSGVYIYMYNFLPIPITLYTLLTFNVGIEFLAFEIAAAECVRFVSSIYLRNSEAGVY